MLKLYRVTGVPEHETHETYIVVNQNCHEEIDDNSVYKEKEEWMDFTDMAIPCVDYTDHLCFPVYLGETSQQTSEEHMNQMEYRKNWILSKIDKWLLQQPEGVSLEQYLLSKQNLNASPYSDGVTTLSEEGSISSLPPGTDFCPYCHEKYFNGICVNSNCPSGSQLSLTITPPEPENLEIDEGIEVDLEIQEEIDNLTEALKETETIS